MGFDRVSNAVLLEKRFCDLPIRLEGTTVEQRAQRVFQQVAKRGIKVTHSIWLSQEWFNPNGVSGFTDAGDAYLLEANPNPQIAKDEDFAQSASHAGISYPELIQQMMQFGMAYKPTRMIY